MPFKNELLVAILLPVGLLTVLSLVPSPTVLAAGPPVAYSAPCICLPWLTIYSPPYALSILLVANPFLLYFCFHEALSSKGREGLLVCDVAAYLVALFVLGINLSTPNPTPGASFVVTLFPVLSVLVVGYALSRSRIGAIPPNPAQREALQRRSRGLTIFLGSVVAIPGLWGLGHIYAGKTARGIELLALGVVLATVVQGLRLGAVLEFAGLGIVIALWAWQALDAYRIATAPGLPIR